LELNPDYVKALYNRSKIHEFQENFDLAIDDAKKIKEIDPSFRNINMYLASLEIKHKEKFEKMKDQALGNCFSKRIVFRTIERFRKQSTW
jgi:hypothetical protein